MLTVLSCMKHASLSFSFVPGVESHIPELPKEEGAHVVGFGDVCSDADSAFHRWVSAARTEKQSAKSQV